MQCLCLCVVIVVTEPVQWVGSIKGVQSESQTGMRRVSQLPITAWENYLAAVATKLYKLWTNLAIFDDIFKGWTDSNQRY